AGRKGLRRIPGVGLRQRPPPRGRQQVRGADEVDRPWGAEGRDRIERLPRERSGGGVMEIANEPNPGGLTEDSLLEGGAFSPVKQGLSENTEDTEDFTGKDGSR